MKRQVPISDFELSRHELMIMLSMVGIYMEYPTVDLLYNSLEVWKKKKSKMDIEDCAVIKANHHKKWSEYFENQIKKEKEQKAKNK
jgi:hypothetical protein